MIQRGASALGFMKYKRKEHNGFEQKSEFDLLADPMIWSLSHNGVIKGNHFASDALIASSIINCWWCSQFQYVELTGYLPPKILGIFSKKFITYYGMWSLIGTAHEFNICAGSKLWRFDPIIIKQNRNIIGDPLAPLPPDVSDLLKDGNYRAWMKSTAFLFKDIIAASKIIDNEVFAVKAN
jgi:hypothetical protein